MKRLDSILFFIVLVIQSPLNIAAQEITKSAEQQLENETNVYQKETQDDSYLFELDRLKRKPLNLNLASEDELKELRILTGLQIHSFLSYRKLLGLFVNIYELQAIPYWDVNTLHQLQPYISIGQGIEPLKKFSEEFKGGEHNFVLRVAQVLEKSVGFDRSTSGTKYQGSPQRIFLRYSYAYKDLLQYGVIGDKDAGEQFFRGAQKWGFDFYSFHFFAKKTGIIESFALGDYTVNLGQGLIQWQSLAFKKSVNVMAIKRQGAVLKPYNSAGEFYFNRGAAITIKKGAVEGTAFVSVRKLSANFVADTVNSDDFISSFLNSGFHRTATEVENRNNLTQLSYGGNLTYKNTNWQVGLNGVGYHFSMPVRKRNEPYNKYAISGSNWGNASVDYSYTKNNFHLFGEAAIDKSGDAAFLNGLLVSVDPKVDISLLQRTISAGFQSVNGNAFTENAYPTNETGYYLGAEIRPSPDWRIDAYADIYRFPWLKYLVDAPSHGSDFLVQLTYTPNKQFEISTKCRSVTRQANQPANNSVTNLLLTIPVKEWRTELSYQLNPAIEFRSRVELTNYGRRNINSENGFLTYADILYKPRLSPLSIIGRIQYFESDGYNSRVYAYENDVLYGYSIPPFFGKGYRYYLLFNYDFNKRISCWMRWAQTIYKENQSIGSGLDEIPGHIKSEVKIELRFLL